VHCCVVIVPLLETRDLTQVVLSTHLFCLSIFSLVVIPITRGNAKGCLILSLDGNALVSSRILSVLISSVEVSSKLSINPYTSVLVDGDVYCIFSVCMLPSSAPGDS